MNQPHTSKNNKIIRWLTYFMFLMFAMTTDAVGVIIPEIIKEYGLSKSQAGLFHYAPMTAIAISGILLGFLADRMGRKNAIILGLSIFSLTSYLFVIGHSFAYFLVLMVVVGIAIGIFKTAALALIGDISTSTREHTTTVNGAEAFFGIGAIIGPLFVTYLIAQGVSWKWLYVAAGVLCTILVIIAYFVQYPQLKKDTNEKPADLRTAIKMLSDPYALAFSIGAFLYVAAEAAIYVWMPTYLLGYEGNQIFLFTYALTIFFVLRALGRFLGMWILANFNWALVMVFFSGAILVCFYGSISFGKEVAIYLLPLSGLFMSVIYPTINSKGISCFPKNKHGTVAGVILFFTAAGAAVGPLTMAVVMDQNDGDAKYGFIVATVFAGALFLGFVFNLIASPIKQRLIDIEKQEYSH